jgi:hypothetical protein
MRQDLEPVHRRAVPDLDRAVRDALAVYYFPGMWDWDRGVRLPLVGQELERAVTRQRQSSGDDADDGAWQETLDQGKALLARYVDWAPKADPFAPVLVETDFEVNVLDPAQADAALVTGSGEPIRYTGRIDMMAVDEHDAYWIVRHRVVGADWLPTEQLVADEESLTACWAWEQFYLGMAITGTIDNELQLPSGQAAAPVSDPSPRARRRRPWRWLPSPRQPPRPKCGSMSQAAEAGRFPSTGGCTPRPAGPAGSSRSSSSPRTASAAPGCAAPPPKWPKPDAGSAGT